MFTTKKAPLIIKQDILPPRFYSNQTKIQKFGDDCSDTFILNNRGSFSNITFNLFEKTEPGNNLFLISKYLSGNTTINSVQFITT
jgi:hypothetical protein